MFRQPWFRAPKSSQIVPITHRTCLIKAEVTRPWNFHQPIFVYTEIFSVVSDSMGIGETTTNDGHTLWYSGEDKYHENGVCFLSPQRHTRSVMECIYSRIITMRLAGQPLNIPLVQVHALTSIASKDEMVWSSSINSYRSRWKLFRKRMSFWPLVIGMRKWELMHIQRGKALFFKDIFV